MTAGQHRLLWEGSTLLVAGFPFYSGAHGSQGTAAIDRGAVIRRCAHGPVPNTSNSALRAADSFVAALAAEYPVPRALTLRSGKSLRDASHAIGEAARSFESSQLETERGYDPRLRGTQN
jgi:hypothetical protein